MRLILCACALVASCATNIEGWKDAPTHTPLAPLFVTVDGASLQAICIGLDRRARYATYFGCVERDYANNVCVVYTEADPPAFIRDHELRHCAGYSHE